MGYVPEHWRCDRCDLRTPKEDLVKVPAHDNGLFAYVCPTCASNLGWTKQKLAEYWDNFRRLLSSQADGVDPCSPLK